MKRAGRALALIVLATSTARGAPPVDESRGNLEGEHGFAVTLGVGAMDFVGKAARAVTTGELGIYADLRLTYGTRTRFGAEAAFTRSQRRLEPGWLPDDAVTLFGQTFEALVRVNDPHHRGRLFFAPFAVAGLGWTDFTPPDDGEPTTPNHRLDRAGIVPVGGGLAASFGNLYAEARFMYRPTFATKLFEGAGRPGLAAWFAGGAVGLEF